MPNRDGTGPNGQGRGQGQGRGRGQGRGQGRGGCRAVPGNADGRGLGGQGRGLNRQAGANREGSWLRQQIEELRLGLQRLNERLGLLDLDASGATRSTHHSGGQQL